MKQSDYFAAIESGAEPGIVGSPLSVTVTPGGLLIDFKPIFLSKNVLAFLCPHCRKVFLTCKNIQLSMSEQYDLYNAKLGELWIPCRSEFAWQFSSEDLATISITPSIDASSSGHWHGNVTNGRIA